MNATSQTTTMKYFRAALAAAFTSAISFLPAPAALAQDGAALYQQNCAACHGARREGAVGPALDGIWNKVQPEKNSLIKVIAEGIPNSAMPGWKGTLDGAKIAALADYLLTPAPGAGAGAGKAAAPGAGAGALAAAAYPELAGFRLPPGFTMSVYADKVDTARSLAIAPSGIVYVGSRKAGKVFALIPSRRGDVADKVVTVASGLNNPIGVAWRDGALYIAEIGRLSRIDNIDKRYDKQPQLTEIKTGLPSDKWHGEKFIKFGPDGKLYIPVGAPCNVCNKEEDQHSKIFRMNADGSQIEEVARGVRNTVGFAWHPQSKELWFTDNGRDMLGDNLPSDKLNHAPTKGLHFGFPYCAGGVIPDPEFAAGRRCAEFVAPVAKLGPHVAALGLEFNNGSHFPAQYKQQLFIAEHGSWNRAQKIGYRVALITLFDKQLVSDTVFIDGFIQNGEVIGRPVDIAFMADGSMLVSDDHKGRVYRISYTEPQKR